MPLFEKRYAEALVESASNSCELDIYRAQLNDILEVFNTYPELNALLSNPEASQEIKKATLHKLFHSSVKSELINLLMLLLDNGRIKHLNEIARVFGQLADEKLNILNITIYSAFAVEDDQLDRISEKYRKFYSASSVRAQVIIDRSLIGGLKVQIGDKLIDGTVKGRLESLRQVLIES